MIKNLQTLFQDITNLSKKKDEAKSVTLKFQQESDEYKKKIKTLKKEIIDLEKKKAEIDLTPKVITKKKVVTNEVQLPAEVTVIKEPIDDKNVKQRERECKTMEEEFKRRNLLLSEKEAKFNSLERLNEQYDEKMKEVQLIGSGKKRLLEEIEIVKKELCDIRKKKAKIDLTPERIVEEKIVIKKIKDTKAIQEKEEELKNREIQLEKDENANRINSAKLAKKLEKALLKHLK